MNLKASILPQKPEYEPANGMGRGDLSNFPFQLRNYEVLHPEENHNGYIFPLLHYVRGIKSGMGLLYFDERRAERLFELLRLPYPNIILPVSFTKGLNKHNNARVFSLQYLIVKQDGLCVAQPGKKNTLGSYSVPVDGANLIQMEIIDRIQKLRLLMGEGE